jgi:hypothetical protein
MYVIVKKLPKEKNQPTGEKSPNLVTLIIILRYFSFSKFSHWLASPMTLS